MSYTLRRLETFEEYKACERLQSKAWAFADDIDIIPQTNLVTAQKWGGLVLGAFDADDELRGFCYGFLGRDNQGRVVHCSHMLAVDDEAQDTGLGTRLKWAQRDICLAGGLMIMVWTFDPLESKNACLNFAKLGGLADRYDINLYGETTSKLHSGTTTDRLTITWMMDSPRVAARQEERRSELFESLVAGDVDAPWVLQADGWAPGEPNLDLDARRLRCEIPGSVQEVKEHDHGIATAWREATRAVFTGYLAKGYFARECARTRLDDRGESKTVYLFERGELEVDGVQE